MSKIIPLMAGKTVMNLFIEERDEILLEILNDQGFVKINLTDLQEALRRARFELEKIESLANEQK